ncbi:hypothetical protein Taro_021578 [Colocasia esculenta]|uniref:Uncharacterized protein n=1 Tax=Colocasia esculenta TaxID=4460 RepID=A0A843VBY7_COLES|nr:hypothetical protein [Colocasia esculenta]
MSRLPVLPVRPFGVEVLADFGMVYAGVVQTCTTSSRVVESFELVLPRGMPQRFADFDTNGQEIEKFKKYELKKCEQNRMKRQKIKKKDNEFFVEKLVVESIKKKKER